LCDCLIFAKKENTLKELISKIKTSPSEVSFQEIISAIDANYAFTPTKFTNGNAVNEAGQNSGSCKVFAFAKLQNLSKEETLACFGDYYRNDVLGNPEGEDHANIRNFMSFGWGGINYEGEALKPL
jgi:hypothetical protein